MNDQTEPALPELPLLHPHDHPESQTMVWTLLEMRAIQEYATAYARTAVAAARAPLLAEIDRLTTTADMPPAPAEAVAAAL
jgi:hypothetical protein